jgi:hypothetical protein
VPTVGAFPDKVAVPVEHIVCVEPLVAVVGAPVTVIVAFAVEAVHGELLIVHLTTYEPAPPAGENTAVGLVKLLN